MRISSWLFRLSAAIGLGVMVAVPAMANTVPIPANPPESHCVTATTKSMKATVEAAMAKDIAPYASNASAATAIANYKMALDEAWAAMTLPYCGYGSVGIADEVHSYNKTTVRVRAAFLAAIVNLKKGIATAPLAVAAPVAVTESVDATPAPVPVPKPASAPVATAKLAKTTSFRGLRIGQRGDDVLTLQKLLVAHFKLTADGRATGYFGPVTRSLLIKFQMEKKIITSANDDAAGMIGPKTNAALASL